MNPPPDKKGGGPPAPVEPPGLGRRKQDWPQKSTKGTKKELGSTTGIPACWHRTLLLSFLRKKKVAKKTGVKYQFRSTTGISPVGTTIPKWGKNKNIGKKMTGNKYKTKGILR